MRIVAIMFVVAAIVGCGSRADQSSTVGDSATASAVSADESSLPPATVQRVRWTGAILLQLIDAPQAPVTVCANVYSVDPDGCFGSDSGYPLQIDSGLASVVWRTDQAEGGRQAKMNLVADWNGTAVDGSFTNGTITPYQPAKPVTYRCPESTKTGHMSAEDAFQNIDLQGLSGSRTLGGSVDANTISWQIMSIDQKGFEAICSSVGPDTNIEITVALTPVAPEPSPSPDCPGHDPLAVAAAFITAVNAGDASRYGPCIYPGSEQDATSLLSSADWVTTIQSGDYQLDDEFERLPNMFSFGSPDLTACTCAPNYYIDPNGRADVSVTLEPDGSYYVTKLGIEVHA